MDVQPQRSARLLWLVFGLSLWSAWCLAPSVCAQDGVNVDARVRVTFSGLRLNRSTGTFDTVASIKNTSNTPVLAPLSLVITQITPASVSLANAAGHTANGTPLITVPVGNGALAPGATLGNIVLKFHNPNQIRFTFHHSILSGAADTTPPVVSITAPLPLTFFGRAPIAVSGDVSPDAIDVTVNGVPAPMLGQTWSATVPLRDGNNVLTAVARDAAGNVGTASIQVTLDTTPPLVTISTPSDGFVTNAPVITVTGMINDLVVGTVNGAQAQVTVNGRPAQVANRSFLAPDIPLAPGSNTITAIGQDRAGNTAAARLTVHFAETLAQPQIRLLSGNTQSGPIGTQVPAPVVVALTDGAGHPVPDKIVLFKVVENNGTVQGSAGGGRALAVTTDGQGLAQTRWTLGTRAGAGNNRLEATAVGFAGKALFTATALAGPPSRISVDLGNTQTGVVGQALPRPLVAVVTDAGQNRLAQVPVTFRIVNGGGNLQGQPVISVNTDSDGRALAVLTLGPEEGVYTNVVEANFPDNATLPATFVAAGLVPGVPAATRLSGVVLDNTNVPIAGVTVLIIGTALATQSDAQGQFVFQPAPVGPVHLHVEGSTAQRPGSWPSLGYDLVTVAGRDNTLGMPVYLLPLDVAHGLFVDETHGGTLTLPQIPGLALTVAPGTATFPDGSTSGLVSVTVVHADKVPMVPNFGGQPRIIITIQPSGVRFVPPAPITLPNLDGLAPGAVTELFSFDHDLGQFVSIGTGSVSEDGTVIRSDPGVGIIEGGWHADVSPAPTGGACGCPECQTCAGTGGRCVPIGLSVEARPETVLLLLGETNEVIAEGCSPGGNYTWFSLDPGVVTVDFAPGNTRQTHPNTAKITALREGNADISVIYTEPSGVSTSDQVLTTVVGVKLMEVSWGGMGQHTMMKTGTGPPGNNWENDAFGVEGDTIIENPVWVDLDTDGIKEKNEPLAYTRGSKPIITQARLKIAPPQLAAIGAQLQVESVTPALRFNITEVNLIGSSITVTNLLTNDSFADVVDNAVYTLHWRISFDNGRTFKEFAVSEHRIFVTFGTPSGYYANPGVTAPRLDRVTESVKGKRDLEAIAQTIRDAVSRDPGFAVLREGQSFIDDRNGNHWARLDPESPGGCDCISLSLLAVKQLRMIGITATEGRAFPTGGEPPGDTNAQSKRVQDPNARDPREESRIDGVEVWLTFFAAGVANFFEGFFEIDDGGTRKAFTIDPVQGPILETTLAVSGDKLYYNVIKTTLMTIPAEQRWSSKENRSLLIGAPVPFPAP